MSLSVAALQVILAFVVWFIEFATKYGLPAVIAIIKDWSVPDEGITLEDIDYLRTLVPPPGTYFEE